MFRIFIFFVAAVFLHLSSIFAYSMDALVDRVVVVNSPNDIRVSFEIRDAFTKEIEDGIKSGISTSFTFFIELYRRRGFWFDESLTSQTFKHIVKYDTLKEEYEIVLEEKPQLGTDLKSVPTLMRVKEIEQAKKIMASGDNIIVKPFPVLQKGERYRLRIKATLDAVNLPFPLNYMLFFVSFWNYETSWYEKEFIMQ
ncbi:MAG: DUF4390 domain-containing protein [Deltaproteobacteria bacterium]|nr:DUF4390 domain-containing protein [Deltaproteobacteria bacterium]